jgi:molybdenum cofactor cytidylyltransferase
VRRAGIAAVVLAAGASSRLGTPKQLLPVRGSPLLGHVLRLCADVGFEETVVVLGYEAARIRATVGEGPGVRFVTNEDFAAGQSTSLRAGLQSVGPQSSAAALFVADQPGLSRSSVEKVIDAFFSDDVPVVRARYRGVPGHPLIAARSVWPLLLRATGDQGARAVLDAGGVEVLDVDLDEEAPRDIDTWEDYEEMTGER